MSQDTIFALATPFGRSGVAVIRISGKNALAALPSFGYDKQQLPPPREAIYHKFTIDQEVIDRGLLLFFPFPHSFTGENCIEFQIHGSIAVIKKVMQELAKVPGFRMAAPGEFARRAFLNGKLDLTAAEGLADLIEAETELQRRQASPSAQGLAAKFFHELRQTVMRPLALLEAYIDFPDEEIPQEIVNEINELVGGVQQIIEYQLMHSQRVEKIRDGFTVILLGSPNAGKSTLINALARRDVAIVSDRAGTTRDLIEVHLDLGGVPVVLIDTAGLRDTGDEVESEGIRRAMARAQDADLKLLLQDGTAPLDSSLAALENDKSLRVITKADLAMVEKWQAIHPSPIFVSAHQPETIASLLREIEVRLTENIKSIAPSFVNRQRQREHLVAAQEQLSCFLSEKSPELQCERLRLAAVEIGKITGVVQVEELLDIVFSSFCIGK